MPNNLINLNNRIKWIDVAKALTMFCVVFGHVLTDHYLQALIYSFQVPAFFFLSGLVFKTGPTFKEFILKRIKTIMIPYYVFGIIAILAYVVFGKVVTTADILPIGKCFMGLLIGSVKSNSMKFNLHIWFLPALFVMNILMYLIWKIGVIVNKKYSLKIEHYYSVVLIISLVVSVFLLNYKTNAYLPLSADTAIRLIPFFILGIRLSKADWVVPDFEKNKKNLLICLIIAVVAFFTLIISAKANMNSFDSAPYNVNYIRDRYGNPFYFYCAALSGTALIVVISKILPHINFICYIGKRSLSVLVMQKFPIMVFNSIIPLTVTLLDEKNIFASVVISIVVMLMCIAVDFMILKIAPFMYGQSYKK